MLQKLKGSGVYFFRMNSIVTASEETIYLSKFCDLRHRAEVREPDSSVCSGEVINRSEQAETCKEMIMVKVKLSLCVTN
jgi:hypothetical protein